MGWPEGIRGKYNRNGLLGWTCEVQCDLVLKQDREGITKKQLTPGS